MKIKIDIFSDAVCPWCYVGKKRLEKAMAELGKVHEFDVVWHPFELNPDAPAEGVPRHAHMARKFGGPERVRLMDNNMKEIGAGEGIEFHQEKIERTPNTFDAHRLVWWAGPEGPAGVRRRQSEVVENLFRAYFVEGRDIGSRSVLAEVAGESGLDRAAVAAMLAGDEGRAEVRGAEQQIMAAGIRAVPLFVLEGRLILEGAEPAESFIQAFESLAKAAAAPQGRPPA